MSFKPQVKRGPVQDEVTLYALNKATYDLIHNVQDSGRPLLVTRENKKVVMIIPILPKEKGQC